MDLLKTLDALKAAAKRCNDWDVDPRAELAKLRGLITPRVVDTLCAQVRALEGKHARQMEGAAQVVDYFKKELARMEADRDAQRQRADDAERRLAEAEAACKEAIIFIDGRERGLAMDLEHVKGSLEAVLDIRARKRGA